jgi:hypothetical protein
LTSKQGTTPINTLKNFDEFTFIVSATNTLAVTIALDGMTAIPLTNATLASQIFESALLTFRYIDGSFYIADQINPKTGNSVLDIAKLYIDTVDIVRQGEYALDGSEINSVDHPIACAIAAASSNYISQATKDANPITYGGYYGFVDELDGSTTVSLPIVGGEFIRMFDDARSVDDGRVFGSWKQDAFQGHWHNVRAGVSGGGWVSRSDGGLSSNYNLNAAREAVSDGVHGAPRIANETRPRSLAYYGKTRL